MAVLSAPALGQAPRTGTLVPNRESTSQVDTMGAALPAPMPPLAQQSADEALAAARQLASCITAASPAKARKFLDATSDGTSRVAYRSMNVLMSTCLGRGNPAATNLRIGTRELMGLVAESYLHARPVPPLAAGSMPGDFLAALPLSDPETALPNRIGACLAFAEPQRTARLVWAAPASADEKAAVADLGPGLRACAPAGARVSAGDLRISAAIALYRRASAEMPGLLAMDTAKGGR